MTKTDEHFTYAQYKNWPDEERWELIDGVAWNMSPAPSIAHQRMLGDLYSTIKDYLKEKDCEIFLAPVDVFFPNQDQNEEDVDTIVQPDLVVVCSPEKIESNGCKGAPDICIEILSPYTSKKDMNEKFRLYEREGVREYWILEPLAGWAQIFYLDEKGQFGNPLILDKKGSIVSRVLKSMTLNLENLLPQK